MTDVENTNLALCYATLLLMDGGKAIDSTAMQNIMKAAGIRMNDSLLDAYVSSFTTVGKDQVEELLEGGGAGGG